jgi:hypothetical protein
MHYYLVDDPSSATGLMAGDPEPHHVHCESALEIESGGLEAVGRDAVACRWRCPDCGGTGTLQYLPEYIERRARELPDPHPMPEPPDGPLDWQDYLNEYFIEGVLFLGVLNEPGYPVRDTSVFVLSDTVHVSLAPGRLPELVVVDRSIDRPYRLRDVERITQGNQGTLFVHGQDSRVGRLDARISDNEKAYVHRWKHTGHDMHPRHCGDAACGYCRNLELAETTQ